MSRLTLRSLSIFFLSASMIIINIPNLSRKVQGAGILFLLLLVFLINNKKYLRRGSVPFAALACAFIYIAFELAYEILGISKCEYIYYYYTISFLFFAFIGPPLIEDMDKREEGFILASYFGSLLYIMYANLKLKQKYGSAYVRLGDIYSASTNVISTQFISAIVLICGALLAHYLYSKKRRLATMIVLAVTVAFEIFVGQRMIAIILMAAMMAVQILTCQRKPGVKYLVVLLGIVVAAVILINIQPILLWVSDSMHNIRITRRVNQLLFLIRNRGIKGTGGSLEVRYNLIINSIHTFFSSPVHFLIGVGDSSTSNLLVGHHSQWIDQAAKYGIVGVVLLFVTLRACFRSVFRAMDLADYPQLRKQYVIFVSYFVLRGLIGAVLYPYFGMALFVILPIMIKRLKKESILGGRQ